MVKLIPARYIGGHPVLLAEHQGDHYDAAGNLLSSNRISYGDTLMMPETEVSGETLFEDVPDTGRLRSLGAGRIYLDPEHAGFSQDELSKLGYHFFQGRPDFEPIVAPVEAPSKPARSAKVDATASESKGAI